MERRLDPLTGQWRTYAGHRQDRTFLPADDECPLCPTRPGHPATEIDAPAFDIVVFDNRFPSFVADPPAPTTVATDLYQVAPAAGAAEVVVYSDRHDITFAGLGHEQVTRLIDVWADRYAELGARDEVAYVFIFENKGEAIGVTLAHPHGQIYAYPDIPPLLVEELGGAKRHRRAHGTCLLCDIVAAEQEGPRVVAANGGFVAHVPFAARFPYEIHVTARRHAPSLVELTAAERHDLAEVLLLVARGYDRLFGFSLPYVMALHQAPSLGGDWGDDSHFHVEFTPIHRSATKLKYLAGSELAAGAFISDVAPEQAAADLRAAVGGAG